MCFQFHNADMVDWLRAQVRVLEVWREQVAASPDLDLDMVVRLEQHYQWLTNEIYNLERMQPARIQAA